MCVCMRVRVCNILCVCVLCACQDNETATSQHNARVAAAALDSRLARTAADQQQRTNQTLGGQQQSQQDLDGSDGGAGGGAPHVALLLVTKAQGRELNELHPGVVAVRLYITTTGGGDAKVGSATQVYDPHTQLLPLNLNPQAVNSAACSRAYGQFHSTYGDEVAAWR